MGGPRSTITAIIDREFPASEIRGVTDVSGGRKATYLVTLPERRVVVSVCASDDVDRFAAEPGVRRLVRRTTGLPVPEVTACGVSEGSLPAYFVSEYVDGDRLSDRYGSLADDARKEILVRAGRYLGELHRGVAFDGFGRLRRDGATDGVTVAGSGTWAACLRGLMDDWIRQLEGGRFADLGPTFERVRDRCESTLSGSFEPTLLHFDYRPANLLTDDREIVAVLDWGLAVAGHSEYDFFKAEKNFLRAQFDREATRDEHRPWLYRGYRDEHGLASGWRQRREFYNLAYKLESMYSFPRWTRGLTPEERTEMERTLRTELDARLERI